MSAEQTSPALRFEEVGKSYGRHAVLAGFDLLVEEGEFFGLVGVNGAGKTTCIKGMLDFCAIDAGSISIFGEPHTETHARRRLAYLPERFLPPYYLSGRDFLRYMAALHARPFDDAAVEQMLASLDLAPQALEESVRAYSKGMAQKLGLAACFLSDKDLVVLDEPMSGLDPKARILVKRHLAGMKARGKSVFLSTHMLADVAELCDRMGILHSGKLRYVGTPEGCCERYASGDLERAYLRCIEAAEAR